MIKNIHDMGLPAGTGKLESLKRQVSENSLQTKKEKDLMKACEGFEAVFLQKIMESMRDTLPGNALFQDSQGMKIFKSMRDQYRAEDFSKSHKFGLSDLLYEQLQKKP